MLLSQGGVRTMSKQHSNHTKNKILPLFFGVYNTVSGSLMLSV